MIPAPTLEDFPAETNDLDARSLLAGWTVLWHPRLLAQTEQLPTWYRADSPPEPDGPRIVVVPNSSMDQLPSDFQGKCQRNKDCQWVTGDDRQAMLLAMNLEDVPTLKTEHRTISIDDFFAAGYASLQVQIMTRRLRYTSNLDEIHLQKQVVAAAKAFLDGDAKATASALHNVFDCLAEERDHYFSSDPYLIDLTLLTPKTLDQLLVSDDLQPTAKREHTARLETPQNILIDDAVAEALRCPSPESKATQQQRETLKQWLASNEVGWIGGAPPSDICFDTMTYADAERCIAESRDKAAQAVGKPPSVYGRFSGSTPSDLTPTLVRLGYSGIVPIDFARGTGHGEEAKVIQQSGGAEIESLTAKPIDASGDSAFLSLGARLGEAIDGGEIATALLAHWPGQASDSFNDLRCVASWCLVLGRFWILESYFRDGEQPYHHGDAKAVTSDAHEVLTRYVADNQTDPIKAPIVAIHESLRQEFDDRLNAMTALAAGKTVETKQTADHFANAIGASVSAKGAAKLVVNPHLLGMRSQVEIDGTANQADPHVFAVSASSNGNVVSVDVPAGGFAIVNSSEGAVKKGLFKRLFADKAIAEGNTLQNEFMEISLSETTGGIQGVYSGGVRGNRFSMRLVHVESNVKGSNKDAEKDESTMVCDSFEVAEASQAKGAIVVRGRVLSKDSQVAAEFDLRYELQRGSRWLHVSGSIHPKANFGDQPWNNYVAARAVVASESAITRVIVRDKLHRAKSRRLVAPLGVVLDEAERQTLIGSAGLAYHRRVGDRFTDTLLAVKGQNAYKFSFAYGFDQPQPVATAKGLLCQPSVVSISSDASLPSTGWITHVSPRDAMINHMRVFTRDDNLLAAHVRIIQTRGKSASLAVRFCRDVQFAALGTEHDDPNQPLPSESETEDNIANVGGVKWKDDTVRLMVSGHQVVDLFVVFKSTSAS